MTEVETIEKRVFFEKTIFAGENSNFTSVALANKYLVNDNMNKIRMATAESAKSNVEENIFDTLPLINHYAEISLWTYKRKWETRTRIIVETVHDISTRFTTVRRIIKMLFSDDNNYLLSIAGRRIYLHGIQDVNNITEGVYENPIQNNRMIRAVFNDINWVNQNTFVTCDEGSVVNIWQQGRGSPIKTLDIYINVMTIDRLFNRIATSNTELITSEKIPIIKIWNLLQFIDPLIDPEDIEHSGICDRMINSVKTVAFSTNKLAASVVNTNDEYTVIVYNIIGRIYNPYVSIKLPSLIDNELPVQITSLSFIDYNSTMMIGGIHGTIGVYETVDFNIINEITPHGKHKIVSFLNSPKNDFVIAKYENSFVSLSVIDKELVLNEQIDLTLSMFESKIRTPYVIVEYMGGFMSGIKYTQRN